MSLVGTIHMIRLIRQLLILMEYDLSTLHFLIHHLLILFLSSLMMSEYYLFHSIMHTQMTLGSVPLPSSRQIAPFRWLQPVSLQIWLGISHLVLLNVLFSSNCVVVIETEVWLMADWLFRTLDLILIRNETLANSLAIIQEGTLIIIIISLWPAFLIILIQSLLHNIVRLFHIVEVILSGVVQGSLVFYWVDVAFLILE